MSGSPSTRLILLFCPNLLRPINTMTTINDITGKSIYIVLDINGNNNISGINVIDVNGRRDDRLDGPEGLRTIDRMVSVSVLATFLRDFPLTYLTKDERRVFAGFQKYIVNLEGQLFEEMGVGR